MWIKKSTNEKRPRRQLYDPKKDEYKPIKDYKDNQKNIRDKVILINQNSKSSNTLQSTYESRIERSQAYKAKQKEGRNNITDSIGIEETRYKSLNLYVNKSQVELKSLDDFKLPFTLITPQYKHSISSDLVHKLELHSTSLITKKSLSPKDNLIVLPISVLGGEECGKTTLIKYILDSSFSEEVSSEDLEIVMKCRKKDCFSIEENIGVKVYASKHRYANLGGNIIALDSQSFGSLKSQFELNQIKEPFTKNLLPNQVQSFKEAQLLALLTTMSQILVIVIDGSQQDPDLSIFVDFLMEYYKRKIWFLPNSMQKNSKSFPDEIIPFLKAKKQVLFVINKVTISSNNLIWRRALESKIIQLIDSINEFDCDTSILSFKGIQLSPELTGYPDHLGPSPNQLNLIYLPDFSSGINSFQYYHTSMQHFRQALKPFSTSLRSNNPLLHSSKNLRFPQVNERQWLACSILAWETILRNRDTLLRSY